MELCLECNYLRSFRDMIKMNIWIYIILCHCSFVTIIVCESVPCDQLSIAPNGLRCYPCGKGYSKVSDCVADRLQSQCKPCDTGKYQPECTTASECARCRICQPNQRIIQECTVSHDRVCECKAGTFWIADAYKTDEGYCKQHSQCGSGQALVREGTAYRDTECEQCIGGKTFSNSTSFGSCRPCTVCTTSYERECSTTEDAVCGQYYSIAEAHSDLLWVVFILVPVAGAVVAVIIVVRYKRYNCFGLNSGNSDEQKQNLSQLQQSELGITEAENFSAQHVNTQLEDNKDMATTESPALSSRNEVQNKTIQKLNTDAVSKKEADKRSREFLNHTQTTEYLAEEPVGKCNSLSEDAGRVSPRSTLSEGIPAVGFYQGVQAVNRQRTFQPQESVESRDSTNSTMLHTSK